MAKLKKLINQVNDFSILVFFMLLAFIVYALVVGTVLALVELARTI